MATETGNYKNIASSNTLIEHIETFAAEYTPTKNSIMLNSLKLFQQKGRTHMDLVTQSKNNWSKIVDERQVGFRDIHKFATRIMGILSGTNLSAKDIETARSINAKIQTVKLIKPKASDLDKEIEDEEEKTHSISRQSYDSLYENMNTLVDFLAQSKGYDPIVKEFKIENLQIYTKKLLTLTNNMDKAVAKAAEARRNRDLFMYTPETGFVDVMLDAKDFIKGLFGAESMQYKTANSIKFKNIR